VFTEKSHTNPEHGSFGPACNLPCADYTGRRARTVDIWSQTYLADWPAVYLRNRVLPHANVERADQRSFQKWAATSLSCEPNSFANAFRLFPARDWPYQAALFTIKQFLRFPKHQNLVIRKRQENVLPSTARLRASERRA